MFKEKAAESSGLLTPSEAEGASDSTLNAGMSSITVGEGDEGGSSLIFSSQAGDFHSGKIGKLVVFKSGKMRMKIGKVVYDVAAGTDCSFLQTVVAVDPGSGTACVLGDIHRKLIVSPNLDHLLKETKNE